MKDQVTNKIKIKIMITNNYKQNKIHQHKVDIKSSKQNFFRMYQSYQKN
jgi:hypothetical protein